MTVVWTLLLAMLLSGSVIGLMVAAMAGPSWQVPYLGVAALVSGAALWFVAGRPR